MTSFRLISVAAAALLFAQLHEAGGNAAVAGGGGGGGSGHPEPKSETIDCLQKMNEERDGAGLGPFSSPSGTSKDLLTKKENVKKICEGITKEKDIDIKLDGVKDVGTFAIYYAFMKDNVCSDAIDFWKLFKPPFEGPRPPAYKTDNDPPYDTYQTRSLMALFNAEPNPTMDCAFVECPYTAAEVRQKSGTGKATEGARGEESKAKPSDTPGEKPKADREAWKNCKGERNCLLSLVGTGIVRSLVCVTSPAALVKDKAPYTQEQWDKVRAQISSGKMYPITAATSFVLAASALWLSAF